MWWQRCARGLVMLRPKIHLASVRKTCCGLKNCFSCFFIAENVRLNVLLKIPSQIPSSTAAAGLAAISHSAVRAPPSLHLLIWKSAHTLYMLCELDITINVQMSICYVWHVQMLTYAWFCWNKLPKCYHRDRAGSLYRLSQNASVGSMSI